MVASRTRRRRGASVREETRKAGLIIVDHGSKFTTANDMLDGVADLVRRKAGDRFVCVEPAHMELSQPSIAEAFARCVAAGAERVVVGLFFLSPGRHSISDIPRLAAEAAEGHPGVEYVVTPPLGLDPRIVDTLLDRAGEAASKL